MTRSFVWRLLAPPLLVPILLLGCGDAASSPAAHAVARDSAGIRIIENAGPIWSDGTGWRIADEPFLEIGLADGEPEYLLDRVTGAIRTAVGEVVIANAGSAEIRYYDAQGRYLKTIGGRGDGPGEFQDLTWLHPYGEDGLMVYDQAARRITTFDAEGEYIRSFAPPAVDGGGAPIPMAPFGDGSLLGRLTVLVGPAEVVTGLRRGSAVYGRFSALDGSLIDSIATLRGEERYLVVEPNMLSVITPLLGTDTYATVHGDRVFLGHSDVHEVRVYALNGELETLIRRSADLVPINSSDVDRLVEARLEGNADPVARQRGAEMFASLPTPEFRPAYSALISDVTGNLWMRETALPGEPNRWAVFDTTGQLLGPIVLPEGFHSLRIGDDFVLGVVTDDLGVERVRLHTLDKEE